MKSSIEIQFEIETTEENGIFSCHIPKYDIYFSAKKEDIERKAKALVESFINYNYKRCKKG